MKRIIAIADTHIQQEPLSTALPQSLLDLIKKADLLVHAGSITSINAYREFSRLTRLKAVWGTKDCPELKQLLPERLTLHVEGVKIAVVHRGAHVTNPMSMRYLAKELGVDVLIYGYLHKPLIDKSDVLTLCPGSPTLPRMSLPSAVQLTVDQGEVRFDIIACSGRVCNYLEFTNSLREQEK